MVQKYSISMSEETLKQLEYLRRRIGLPPEVKRSQLISAVIYRLYLDEVDSAADPPTDPPKLHGFKDCPDDCEHCPDEPICDYCCSIDRFII